MSDLVANLHHTLEKIRFYEQKYNRHPGSVSLLAVSKTQPSNKIATLSSAAQYDFGENYVQGSLDKISALADKNLVWHYLGRIQSNKATLIAQNFSWVHSLTRIQEALDLSKARAHLATPLDICIQVKLYNNPAKLGICLDELQNFVDELLPIPHLKLRGLMVHPPLAQDFETQRNHFKLVHEHFLSLQSLKIKLDTLSMGTSHDYEAAIAEGATLVRLGTAIFGPRTTHQGKI